MGGDFLYFLHRHFRVVFVSGLVAAGTAFALLLASAARATHGA